MTVTVVLLEVKENSETGEKSGTDFQAGKTEEGTILKN